MLKYGKDCLAQKLDFHLKQAYLQPLNTPASEAFHEKTNCH